MEEDKKLATEEEEESWLDYILDKVVSRKLTVMMLVTVFFVLGMLSEDSFMMIATGYMGAQSLIDLAKMWRETK